MPRKIVIIGAVALGPKAACRARRLDPGADIVMIDRDSRISYGGCGIPYYLGGDVSESRHLCETPYHVLRDETFFREAKRIDVRTRTQALAIDRKARTVRIQNLDSGAEADIPYDALVLAMGSRPAVPPIPGRELANVHTMANLHEAEAVKALVQSGAVSEAVVVGAGAIGLEVAEALADLWGVRVTVVEEKPHLLPQALGPDMAAVVRGHLKENGVEVLSGERVAALLDDGQGRVAGARLRQGGDIPCQLVILATGARPETSLARACGLAVGQFGGILVDERLRTSDPDIYAGGDCIEVRHLVSGQSVHLPLGSLANRQGRVIGTNIAGGRATFEGAVGTFCLKVFGLGVSRAGLTAEQARAAGFDPVAGQVAMVDRAHFYPTKQTMYLTLLADRATRTVLGVEAVGANIDAVKARVDAVAALLPAAPSCQAVSNLEVGYSPPFSSAMDIVNVCGNVLDNILDGRNQPMGVQEFARRWREGGLTVIDTRLLPPGGAAPGSGNGNWLRIPQEELAARLDEIPRDRDAVLFCNTGLRSYDAQCLLAAEGIRLPMVQGGWVLLNACDPGGWDEI
jgi:NADPH-dependent 2,4-dienoyl-CoA reductase/sulfur reductase-like enzyme/rhodanese-related sulfurtransferase